MKASILVKLDTIAERYEEVGALLSDPEIIGNQNKFRELSIEYSEIEPVVQCFAAYRVVESDLAEAKILMKDSDPEMREMGVEEMKRADAALDTLTEELQKLLLPRDPKDGRSVYLEVRAGTGGDEASIFAGDLFKMYSRFAESQGWRIELMSENRGEHGGFKEVVALISGQNVYARLKFESGVHRVQRVPETESQGRVHTSACTVAIMAEADEQEAIEITKADLRIDTFRASGAGGQHVNKTDSAIRLTHIPTGLVVECQDERSQHKNRAKAMSVLAARLSNMAEASAAAERADERKGLVGTGDRSERIRTYNFPQGRLTDHRINLTLYKLNEIMEGDIDCVIQPLINEYQAEQLTTLGNDD